MFPMLVSYPGIVRTYEPVCEGLVSDERLKGTPLAAGRTCQCGEYLTPRISSGLILLDEQFTSDIFHYLFHPRPI